MREHLERHFGRGENERWGNSASHMSQLYFKDEEESEIANHHMVHDLLSALEKDSGASLKDLVLGLPLSVLEEAMFELVCDVMRVDPALCRSKGVKMVLGEVFKLEAAQAGLDPSAQPDDGENPKFHEGANAQDRESEIADPNTGIDDFDSYSKTAIGLVHWETFCEVRSQGQQTLTIGLETEPRNPFYEAVTARPGSSKPSYRVFGVWMPFHHDIRIAEVGAAIVDQTDANAWLV